MWIACEELEQIFGAPDQEGASLAAAGRIGHHLEIEQGEALEALARRLEQPEPEDAALRLFTRDGEGAIEEGAVVFLAAALLAQALGEAEGAREAIERAEPSPMEGAHHLEGDLQVRGGLTVAPGGVVLVAGDLRVAGDVRLGQGARLIVLGRCLIEGDWFSEADEAIGCVVGDLEIHNALFSTGELIVGGHLGVPFAYVCGERGELVVLRGVRARVLIEDEHGASRVWGDSVIDFVILDELKGLDMHEDAINLENLRRVLLEPGLVPSGKGDEEVDFFDLTEALIEMAQQRQALFLGEQPGWIFATEPS